MQWQLEELGLTWKYDTPKENPNALRRVVHLHADRRCHMHVSSITQKMACCDSWATHVTYIYSALAYKDVELAGEEVLDGVHERLPLGAHGDVADGEGDGDLETLELSSAHRRRRHSSSSSAALREPARHARPAR